MGPFWIGCYAYCDDHDLVGGPGGCFCHGDSGCFDPVAGGFSEAWGEWVAARVVMEDP